MLNTKILLEYGKKNMPRNVIMYPYEIGDATTSLEFEGIWHTPLSFYCALFFQQNQSDEAITNIDTFA